LWLVVVWRKNKEKGKRGKEGGWGRGGGASVRDSPVLITTSDPFNSFIHFIHSFILLTHSFIHSENLYSAPLR